MWAHCGDSRLYWFRDGRLRAQTRDHSVPGSLAAAGEIAPEQIRFHADRSRLRRSLGGKTEAQVTIGSIDHPIQSGDAYLLSSDGFWEWVTEPEMEADLTASAGADDWLQRMQFRLRERASADHDNYSAIAVLVTNGGGHLTPEHSV
jgi:serine/threonine protein phosphatase PrpC